MWLDTQDLAGAFTVRDCAFAELYETGVYLPQPGHSTVQNNSFTDVKWPIRLESNQATCSGSTYAGNTMRAITVSGSLQQDITWHAGQVYWIANSFNIPAGRTLTIEAGVVVKFDTSSRLTFNVDGTLNLQGTASQKVVFTSGRDDAYGGDSNGDGSTSPTTYDWGTIRFGNPNNVFHDAIVRYGGCTTGGWPSAAVWLDGSTPGSLTIFNCTIESIYQTAILLQNSSAQTHINTMSFAGLNSPIQVQGGQALIERISFVSYGTAAVAVSGTPTVQVRLCNFIDTEKDYGINNQSPNQVLATGNWWGDPSGPSTVGPGLGVKVSTNVNYSAWLSSSVSISAGVGPTITSTPSTHANYDTAYLYDADGHAAATGNGTITWSKLYGPAGFTVNPATGEITWHPLGLGTFNMAIMASDSTGSSIQSFAVYVDMPQGTPAPPKVISFNYSFTGSPSTPTAQLSAGFSRPVLVNYSDLVVLDNLSQTVPITSYSYSLADNTVSITVPSLILGHTYRLVLSDTIEDLEGYILDGEFDGSTLPSGNGSPGGAFVAAFIAATNSTPFHFDSIMRLAGGRAQLNLSGGFGTTCRIQASTNLLNWDTLATLANTTGTLQYTDTNAPSFNRRFYRAVAP